jgi:hypothetical protein
VSNTISASLYLPAAKVGHRGVIGWDSCPKSHLIADLCARAGDCSGWELDHDGAAPDDRACLSPRLPCQCVLGDEPPRFGCHPQHVDAPRQSMVAHTIGPFTVLLAQYWAQKKAAAVPKRICVPEHATLWHAGMLGARRRHEPTARRVAKGQVLSPWSLVAGA